MLSSCELDGVRGRVVQIDGASYIVKSTNGEEIRLYVDDKTRKDDFSTGDEVFSYVGRDGHAAFVQRLN